MVHRNRGRIFETFPGKLSSMNIATIEELIRVSFVEMAGELRVCLPGRIETYDPETHLASIQPLIKRKFYGQDRAELLPIVNRVPIIHPRTAKALIRLPVASGDIVTIIFADRSIEPWLQGNGAEAEALDTRQHHLSDAYALLGGYPEGNPITANNPDALEIVVAEGTKITVGNGAEELLQLAHNAFTELKNLVDEVSQTLTDIQSITHAETGGTTGPPLNAAAFVTIKVNVDAIGTTVDTVVSDLEKIKN